jgi:hypothetical protein
MTAEARVTSVPSAPADMAAHAQAIGGASSAHPARARGAARTRDDQSNQSGSRRALFYRQARRRCVGRRLASLSSLVTLWEPSHKIHRRWGRLRDCLHSRPRTAPRTHGNGTSGIGLAVASGMATCGLVSVRSLIWRVGYGSDGQVPRATIRNRNQES